MFTIRRFGSILLLIGCLSLGAAALASPVSAAGPVYNSALKADQLGSANPGYTTGTCPTAGWGWHFVFGGNSTTFVNIKVTFQNAGDITVFSSSPTAKHAYVYTPGPDTLLAAVAESTGPLTEFNLGNVCTGSAVTTTTADITTTTADITTTTAEITTTTAEITTTSEDVTTTSEDVTTTSEDVTTTSEDTTTTTEIGVLPSSTIAGTSTTVPGSVAAVTSTTSGPTPSPQALPRTGSNSRVLALTGFMLVLLGATLVLRGRALDPT